MWAPKPGTDCRVFYCFPGAFTVSHARHISGELSLTSASAKGLGMVLAAGNRTIQLLGAALDALKAQHELTAGHPVSTITFHHREYGSSEEQNLRFVFMPRRRKGEQKTLLLAQQYRQQMGSCSKTRWHSPQESVPYAAYFCLLAPDGWRKPVFYSQSDGAWKRANGVRRL